jgi:hypothetical protein
MYSGFLDEDDPIRLPPKDNIIANNIITMDDAAPIYTQHPEYGGIDEFWEGNILNGSNPGDVPDSGFVQVDPALSLVNGWYQITASSPAIDAAMGDYPYIVDAIDGVAREQEKDVGADELGNGPRQPLTADDVGPEWFNDPNLPVGLNLNISGLGTVLLDPAGGVYPKDTWVTLTAVPTEGHTFAGWSGDLVSANNPDSILMDENKTILATFDPPIQYNLAVWHIGSGTTELDPAGGKYSPGTNVSVLAVPESGWLFEEWGGSLSGTNNPDTLIMNENKAVTVRFVQDPTAIVNANQVPLTFNLKQNFPNPFNPATTIQFSLLQSDQTRLKVFDTLGNEVDELVNEHLQAGTYQINYNASQLASGVYYYKLTSGKYQAIKKMILMR